MSYLAFRERSRREALVAGPAVRFIERRADEALRAEITRPRVRPATRRSPPPVSLPLQRLPD